MVKEECERILGRLEDKRGGLIWLRNGKYGWEEDGDEKRTVNMWGKSNMEYHMVKEH